MPDPPFIHQERFQSCAGARHDEVAIKKFGGCAISIGGIVRSSASLAWRRETDNRNQETVTAPQAPAGAPLPIGTIRLRPAFRIEVALAEQSARNRKAAPTATVASWDGHDEFICERFLGADIQPDKGDGGTGVSYTSGRAEFRLAQAADFEAPDRR